MNKKTSNALKQAKQPTEEQLQAEKNRVLRQKLMAMSESIYIALAQNSYFSNLEPQVLIDRSIELASAWMKTFYGLVRKEETEENETEKCSTSE